MEAIPVNSAGECQQHIYYKALRHDSRLALLPFELLANACVFDVGCDEGLTRQSAERL
jgi:hypothetical protein